MWRLKILELFFSIRPSGSGVTWYPIDQTFPDWISDFVKEFSLLENYSMVCTDWIFMCAVALCLWWRPLYSHHYNSEAARQLFPFPIGDAELPHLLQYVYWSSPQSQWILNRKRRIILVYQIEFDNSVMNNRIKNGNKFVITSLISNICMRNVAHL